MYQIVLRRVSFCLCFNWFLDKENWGLIEALAIVTLIKYGVWAVVVNGVMIYVEGPIGLMGYMLMLSHFAMAVQGVLYAPFYRIKMAFCGSSYMDIT